MGIKIARVELVHDLNDEIPRIKGRSPEYTCHGKGPGHLSIPDPPRLALSGSTPISESISEGFNPGIRRQQNSEASLNFHLDDVVMDLYCYQLTELKPSSHDNRLLHRGGLCMSKSGMKGVGYWEWKQMSRTNSTIESQCTHTWHQLTSWS